MISTAILTSAARSALVGAVATKLIDTLLISKVNNKLEQKRWLRNTKLELFSKLSEAILDINKQNLVHSTQKVKRVLAKIVLLLNDKTMIVQIEHYLSHLEAANTNDTIDIDSESIKLLELLGRNIQRI
jgi:uncharacterized protein YbcC (UPF0753/DUF2309 family)